MPKPDPRHPGQIFRETCLERRGVSVTAAAKALGITRKALSELLNGHVGMTAEMAVRIAKVFGSSAEMWLVLQLEYDLRRAEERLSERSLRPIDV